MLLAVAAEQRGQRMDPNVRGGRSKQNLLPPNHPWQKHIFLPKTNQNNGFWFNFLAFRIRPRRKGTTPPRPRPCFLYPNILTLRRHWLPVITSSSEHMVMSIAMVMSSYIMMVPNQQAGIKWRCFVQFLICHMATPDEKSTSSKALLLLLLLELTDD